MEIESPFQKRTKRRRSGMKMACDDSVKVFQTPGVMPPRWGLGFVGDAVGYKGVAPLALPPSNPGLA